jgi:hypothetical protein
LAELHFQRRAAVADVAALRVIGFALSAVTAMIALIAVTAVLNGGPL